MDGTQPRRWGADGGFTLIEVLLVVLVLSALLAIAIPALTDQRAKAHRAAGKAEARLAYTALETLRVERQTYDVRVAELVAVEPELAGVRDLELTGTREEFRLTVQARSGVVFGVERLAGGSVRRFCSPAGTSACRPGGSW
jgi:prepilin-type N-terminal cleavage/methylation domain-containing protein